MVGQPLRPAMGVRPLKGRSYTARVKKEKMHQSAKRRPGGSYSYFNYGGKFKPAVMKGVRTALAKHVKLLTVSDRLMSSVGKQTVGNVSKMFTVTDMKDICDDIDASSFRRIMFNSVKSKSIMQNQDNGIARLIIYDCIARRDSSNDSYDSASAAWTNGASAFGDANIPFIPGATPYGTPGFTSSFKVLKTTHVQLAPGELHEHVTSFRPNKMLDTNILFSSEHDTLKGFSVFTMVVLTGGPANDTVNDAQISLGACKIDFINTKEYRYVYLDKSVPTYKYTNGLPTAFTNAEEAMNVATGAPATEDWA